MMSRRSTDTTASRVGQAVGLLTFCVIAMVGSCHADKKFASPITAAPLATWVPAVNGRELFPDGGGFVPPLWRAEFDDGTTCFVASGIFGDQLSCVRGDR